MGAVAKSYMTNGLLRYDSYIRKPFLLYDFATIPFRISLNMRKILFSFLSVYMHSLNPLQDLKRKQIPLPTAEDSF
jgi:hypothetical protein